MTKETLLNEPTDNLLSKEATRQTAITFYVIITIAIIMVLSIFICVKSKEIELLKGKAHNDSLAYKSLNDNLLMPR